MDFIKLIEETKKEKDVAGKEVDNLYRPFNEKRHALEMEAEKATFTARKRVEDLQKKIEKLYLDMESEKVNNLKEKFKHETPDESNFIEWLEKIGFEIIGDKLSSFDDKTIHIKKDIIPGLTVLGAVDYRKKIYVAFQGVKVVGWLVVYPSSHPGDSTSAECKIQGNEIEKISGSYISTPFKSFVEELKKAFT